MRAIYKYYSIIVLVLFALKVVGQKDLRGTEKDLMEDVYPKSSKAVIVNPDFTIELNYLNNGKLRFVKENKRYAWYKANTVLVTTGDYDGKLLDGVYKEFYKNKNLKTKGFYDGGLKVGQWKEWYPSGEMSLLETWRGGLRNGKFQEFNESGEVIKEGAYKRNLLTGKLKEWNNGELTITRWKKGKEIIKSKHVSRLRVKSHTNGSPGKRISADLQKIKAVFHPHHKKDKKQNNNNKKVEPANVRQKDQS